MIIFKGCKLRNGQYPDHGFDTQQCTVCYRFITQNSFYFEHYLSGPYETLKLLVSIGHRHVSNIFDYFPIVGILRVPQQNVKKLLVFCFS